MEKTIGISTEYIKLSQLLKLAGITGQGSDAKYFINEVGISLNGVAVTERGKKIRSGDVVEIKDVCTIKVESHAD